MTAPEQRPARLALAATVHAGTATALDVHATYARSVQPDGEMLRTTIPLPSAGAAPGATIAAPLALDLGACLGDPRHAPSGDACTVTLRLTLLAGDRALDEAVIGPLTVRPGETMSPPTVSLFEVGSIQMAAVVLGTVYPGATVQFTGRVVDRTGAAVDGRVVTWRSEPLAVATVDGTGLVTTVAPGTATITAESGGRSAEATLTILPLPEIQLSQDAVAFTAVRGDAAPAAVEIAVANAHEGPLPGLALGTIRYDGAQTGWLAASLSGSAAPATLTVSAAHTDLPAGSYTADVDVTAGTATNSPQTVRVTYAVQTPAALVLSTTAIDFDAEFGIPDAVSVSVSLSESGTAGAPAISIQYLGSHTGWLSLSTSGSTEPYPLLFSVQPATLALPPGTYQADVHVEVDGVSNSPQTVRVTYTVPDFSEYLFVIDADVDLETVYANSLYEGDTIGLTGRLYTPSEEPVNGVTVTWSVAPAGAIVLSAAAAPSGTSIHGVVTSFNGRVTISASVLGLADSVIYFANPGSVRPARAIAPFPAQPPAVRQRPLRRATPRALPTHSAMPTLTPELP